MLTDRIKQIREKLELNQSDFAQKLKISQSAISEFENGTREPSKAFLLSLKNLGISLDWFLTGNGEIMLNNKLKFYTTNRKTFRRVDESANQLDTCPKNKPTCWLNDAPNVAKVGKETNPNERPDIQSSLEELARQALAPDLKKINEQIEEKEKEIATYEKRIAEIEKLLKKEFGKTEEVNEAKVAYGASVFEEEDPTIDLPLAENLAAGVPIEACYNCESYAVPTRFLKKDRNYCVAKIKGTSMVEAGIPDGAFVLLEYTNQGNDGDIAVVTHDGYTTLKRLQHQNDGSWELRYEDGSGAIIPLKEGAWDVLGIFVRVL